LPDKSARSNFFGKIGGLCLRISCPILLALAFACSYSFSAYSTEGFYDANSFSFPKTINRADILSSTVRIQSKLFLNLNVFESSEDLEAWVSQDPVFNDDGSAILNTGFLKSDVPKCKEPSFYNGVSRFEFCKAVRKNVSFPSIVPFEGGATGSFVSDDGYILTAHHVATWCIKKLNMGDGKNTSPPMPCRNLSIEVFSGFDQSGIPEYKTIQNVSLVANSSENETWLGHGKMGLDVALLKVDFKPRSHFVIEPNNPKAFDRIFMIGHPIRSERDSKRLDLLGYRNADNSMRASVGMYLKQNSPDTFISDLDGGPGNSGSPVINGDGRWVGLLSTSIGNPERAPLEYGSFNPQHVFASSICTRLELRRRFPSIDGCK
jgi:S1-C subfamily serine protease